MSPVLQQRVGREAAGSCGMRCGARGALVGAVLGLYGLLRVLSEQHSAAPLRQRNGELRTMVSHLSELVDQSKRREAEHAEAELKWREEKESLRSQLGASQAGREQQLEVQTVRQHELVPCSDAPHNLSLSLCLSLSLSLSVLSLRHMPYEMPALQVPSPQTGARNHVTGATPQGGQRNRETARESDTKTEAGH